MTSARGDISSIMNLTLQPLLRRRCASRLAFNTMKVAAQASMLLVAVL
jgi:hypothetical protein